MNVKKSEEHFEYDINISDCKPENKCSGTWLVAQWVRIRLPVQGTGFDPWSGKIPHTTEQLSPCATTTEPVL